MNNNSYHTARSIPGWKRMTPYMQARYGRWKANSDASWTTNYLVLVLRYQGRSLRQAYRYPFQKEEDAKECSNWWAENGFTCVVGKIEEVDK